MYSGKYNENSKRSLTTSASDNVLHNSLNTSHTTKIKCLQSLINFNGKAIKIRDYYNRYANEETPTKLAKETDHDKGDSSLESNIPNESISSEKELSINYILEQKSRELQTDSSFDSLNIQFFKMTVEEILSRFYDNLDDFDKYKQKYQEIISRNNEDVESMKCFLKDVLQNIKSNNEVSNEGPTELQETNKKELSDENLGQYNTTSFNTSSNTKTYTIESEGSGDINKNCNIYLVGSAPHVQIKMNDRNISSEINIHPGSRKYQRQTLSTNNIGQVTENKSLLSTTTYGGPGCILNEEKDIPVKNAKARYNILNNEIKNINKNNNSEIDDGILYRLCKYFCRKLGRN